MSTWRKIWTEAISANHELCLNRSKGESAFRRLLEAHPDDGMIYYERAEAYEYLNELDAAEADYKTAEKYFPVMHWKTVAREGIARIQLKKQAAKAASTLPNDTQWGIFHRVHAVPQIPHEIRVDALSAIARFDSEPHIAAAQLRLCLEQLVVALLEKIHVDYSDAGTLEKRIALLDSLEVIPSPIVLQMDRLRDLGNKGIHAEKRKRPVNFSPCMSAFADIVEWAGANLLRQK
jgi:tetratricopeptide (TPR) repeat protein